MEGYIINALAMNGTVRVLAADTTSIARQAQKMHMTSPVATAALGRTLTASVMMSSLLKGEKDSITIQIKGDGPLGSIVAVADSKGNARGYVNNPDIDIPLKYKGKLDVGSAVGKNGYVTVIKDLGLKEPYVGQVDLVSGEIAEDMAYYLACSEQVPSAVALGVLIEQDGTAVSAGGFLIQLMPDAEEEAADFLDKRIRQIEPISVLLSKGMKPENIIEYLLEDKDFRIVSNTPCQYKCYCSRERMERNLMSLGKKEIEDIIAEQGEAELQCHFCNAKYFFSGEELKNIVWLINSRNKQ